MVHVFVHFPKTVHSREHTLWTNYDMIFGFKAVWNFSDFWLLWERIKWWNLAGNLDLSWKKFSINFLHFKLFWIIISLSYNLLCIEPLYRKSKTFFSHFSTYMVIISHWNHIIIWYHLTLLTSKYLLNYPLINSLLFFNFSSNNKTEFQKCLTPPQKILLLLPIQLYCYGST